ncbi:cobalt-precorrin-5B (C(1))-methyltransferase [Chthonobacter albigriseus]|uniref:cobalt-precorrin-5B (C(1))-methyltransferase n=1 Tax=Chthonobacter albigriseus TaxID=1683161 RepID=UPI0015EFA427|nr:cobalt-precorrin-5B (C(1))-methyltransferase [Chthonobacter albigriseus]
MDDEAIPSGELKRGWTTGTCAAAGAKAAYVGWVTGEFPDPVDVLLPGGQRPAFALARTERTADGASTGIVKDAGDDPDVTHGALIWTTVGPAPLGSGVTFRAGPGVGTVTRPGLPVPPGEPAINPMPREMIRTALAEAAAETGGPRDVTVTVSIPGGEEIARRTLNGRLGIVGGLSILGTTGIVVPFSCAAWIHSIHRGIDVARASGLTHVAGATGSTSEAAVQKLHALPEVALIEMGDFVGGMLKYLRRHPVPRVTVAGGFAKMVKLGQGMIDLHSRAGPIDMAWLADRAAEAGADEAFRAWVPTANAANEVLVEALARGIPLADVVARHAFRTAAEAVGGGADELEIAVFDRQGGLVSRVPFTKVG